MADNHGGAENAEGRTERWDPNSSHGLLFRLDPIRGIGLHEVPPKKANAIVCQLTEPGWSVCVLWALGALFLARFILWGFANSGPQWSPPLVFSHARERTAAFLRTYSWPVRPEGLQDGSQRVGHSVNAKLRLGAERLGLLGASREAPFHKPATCSQGSGAGSRELRHRSAVATRLGSGRP